MSLLQILKKLLFYLSLCMVVFISQEKSFGQEQGELKLVGEYIESLVLQGKNGTKQSFHMKNEIKELPTDKYQLQQVYLETIELPVGEYRLQQVCLKGGYTHNLSAIYPESEWITVSKDEPAVLKVGAPLKQTVEVKRKGRYLILNYKLLGLGGESYISSDSNKPPIFTIYRGEKEIASDKFQFG